MPNSDKPLAPSGQFSADLVIIGGGVAGCWAALKALRSGLSVILVEKQHIGAGASGGFLGALMPHMPERWDEKKAFQFAALVALENEVEHLEADTGMGVGYHRVGRLMPLASERQRRTAEFRGPEAANSWQGLFTHNLVAADGWDEWLDPATAPEGMVYDTLSARISPPDLLAALVAACTRNTDFTLLQQAHCHRVDHQAGRVHLSDGRTIAFGQLFLCNGLGAFRLIEGICGLDTGSIGNAVKGQAALFEVAHLPAQPSDLPLIYDNGAYVIAHESGCLAVGSTSETEFSDPSGTDDKLDEIIARASLLCPALRNARLVARWAGLRPRPAGRDPMLGKLPGQERIFTITGGYKISFGIAHRMADAVLSRITGAVGPDIPSTFTLEHHFAKAGMRRQEKSD